MEKFVLWVMVGFLMFYVVSLVVMELELSMVNKTDGTLATSDGEENLVVHL